jgi:hypothetical protein
MPEAGHRRTARYSAFISYSHVDSAFARRLHRRLEGYHLPKGVAAKGHADARRPGRLKPVFRDRDELAAASDLSAAVRSALAQSDYLIVVCSPAAALSAWVNLEIRAFRDLHGGARILAALISGAPEDALPPALLGDGGDGARAQPLAADFRRDMDGERLAFLKLAAALAGVPLDRLVQRDAQRRIRQIGALSAAAVVILGVTGFLTLTALRARDAARQEQARGRGVVDYMLTDLRARLKRTGRLDVLDAVNKGAMRYDSSRHAAALTPAALIERAKLLQALGDDDGRRNDYAAARANFDKASAITAALYKARPKDPAVIFADAQSQYYNGYVRWRTGDLPGALEGLEGYADRANRLVSVDPKNFDWLLERGYANSNLGLFALRQSVDLNQARADFTAAQAAFEAVARQRPTDADVAFDVTDGYAWLADTQRLAGDYAGARAQRLHQRALLEAMLKRDPGDFHARAGVVSNSLGLARIALAQGRVEEADRELKSAHALAHDIAQAEPADKDAARQERIIELFQARAWMAMPPLRRPARATILRAVGDCEADAARPHNQELAEFCTILRARAQGAPVPIPTPAPNAPRLSERWLLDFAQEARSARIDPRTTPITN